MKIVVLSPEEHFHSPVVLRELCAQCFGDNILVVTTPKFSMHKSLRRQIKEMAEVSGWDYLISMARASFWFSWNAFREKLSGIPFERRGFLQLEDVIRHFGLESRHFKSINDPDAVKFLREIQPDLIVANLFNQIVKEPVLKIPRLGCLNVHTSYLPAYRGIAPNFWALANGEKEFGTTLHFMTSKIDDGDIVARKKVEITRNDTVFSLYRRCSVEAAKMLPSAIRKIEQGKGEFLKQDSKSASYFSRITRGAFKKLRENQRKFF